MRRATRLQARTNQPLNGAAGSRGAALARSSSAQPAPTLATGWAGSGWLSPKQRWAVLGQALAGRGGTEAGRSGGQRVGYFRNGCQVPGHVEQGEEEGF